MATNITIQNNPSLSGIFTENYKCGFGKFSALQYLSIYFMSFLPLYCDKICMKIGSTVAAFKGKLQNGGKW